MAEVTIIKGLPGSGKSFWARQQVEANPGQVKRVNKDDIRAMVDGGRWSKANEKMVLDIRDAIIRAALERNCHILVDDTNLAPTHEERIRHLVSEINKSQGKQHRVLIEDFTNVPLETCIERDLNRERSVGEKVIRDMYDRYLKPPQSPAPEWDASLPTAVICDLDGTLALLNGRNPYDASTCDQDGLNEPVAQAIRLYRESGCQVILMSGRPDIHREPTERFLEKHKIQYDYLLMRAADDWRKDVIVKQEIYDAQIKGRYNIVAVFDDRLQVARMWHQLGLPLFRVGDPDSDF